MIDEKAQLFHFVKFHIGVLEFQITLTITIILNSPVIFVFL